jgi:hypothetical protein
MPGNPIEALAIRASRPDDALRISTESLLLSIAVLPSAKDLDLFEFTIEIQSLCVDFIELLESLQPLRLTALSLLCPTHGYERYYAHARICMVTSFDAMKAPISSLQHDKAPTGRRARYKTE